jgi:hypothetical protein
MTQLAIPKLHNLVKRVKQRKRRLLVGMGALRVRARLPATPSNCGKFLKPALPSGRRKAVRGRGNDLGYGKNALDATMDDPQPSPKSGPLRPDMGAVQRLNGGGFRRERVLRTPPGLKI